MDKKRNRIFLIMCVIVYRVFSGCVFLRIKGLIVKDFAVFFLIYIRFIFIALKKFVFKMYSEEYEYNKYVLLFYVYSCLLLFEGFKKNVLLLLVCFFFKNYYILLDLISFEECFYNWVISFFFLGDINL